MKPDQYQDGDRIIRDDSGSYVSFSRDISLIKKSLGLPVKSALQLCGVLLLIVVIISVMSEGKNITFFLIFTESLCVGCSGAIMITGIYIKNRFILNKICSKFTVYNDRIDIDGKQFELGKIRSAFMTPFEYYERRYISFEYNNKKYRYYFGKFNGICKSELFYKPYVQMNMLLESRGFSNKY